MTEQNKNSNLAIKISSISLISFFAAFILCVFNVLGGLVVILSGIGGLVGATLGAVSKNKRAVIFGAIPAVLTVVLIIVGYYVKSQTNSGL